MRKKVNTMEELTYDLFEVYNNLRDGEIGQDMAKTSANVAGKIIGASKVQIEYNKMIQSNRQIPFLNAPEK